MRFACKPSPAASRSTFPQAGGNNVRTLNLSTLKLCHTQTLFCLNISVLADNSIDLAGQAQPRTLSQSI